MPIPPANPSKIFPGMGIGAPKDTVLMDKDQTKRPIEPQVLGNSTEGTVLLKPIKLNQDVSPEGKI